MSRNEKIINYCLMLAISAAWLVVWSWSAWDSAFSGQLLAFCVPVIMIAGWGMFIKEWANLIRLAPLTKGV